jgi:hypothetical protein
MGAMDENDYGDRPNPHSRSGKVIRALEGDDEFSMMSVDPRARAKPVVKLADDSQGRPSDTRASRSVLRFLRKIFSE